MSEKLNRDPAETLVVSPIFTHTNQMHRYEVGEVSRTTMVNYFIPGMYLLIVPDGGPESLKWTAAIYNSTKKEIISEYTRFHHGYN